MYDYFMYNSLFLLYGHKRPSALYNSVSVYAYTKQYIYIINVRMDITLVVFKIRINKTSGEE